jgi:hypothetical protein
MRGASIWLASAGLAAAVMCGPALISANAFENDPMWGVPRDIGSASWREPLMVQKVDWRHKYQGKFGNQRNLGPREAADREAGRRQRQHSQQAGKSGENSAHRDMQAKAGDGR